jgi:polyisoprenoid-binding protein YceI
MQEHFNEDYMESEKYPIAIFKGKIIEPLAIKIGTVQEIQVSGDLTIHGITQNRTISVTLKYEEAGRINAASKFIVRVADHKIKIPQMVFTNIAEAVDVTMNFNLISK